MLQPKLAGRFLSLACVLCCFFGTSADAFAQATNAAATLLEIENSVEVLRAGATVWDPTRVNQPLFPGDRVRTGARSRSSIRLSSLTVVRLGELAILQVPEAAPGRAVKVNLFKGLFYFFHRDQANEFEVQTPTVAAVVRGTDFTFQIVEDDRSTIALLDGRIQLTNSFGGIEIETGDVAIMERGLPPSRTALVAGMNSVQWCLYYPGILDVDELSLSEAEKVALHDSLGAYREGDIVGALGRYPTNRTEISLAERAYLAALSLAVGQVQPLKEIHETFARAPNLPGAEPLRRVIAALMNMSRAVARQDFIAANEPALTTEWMAESYIRQARGDLKSALTAAETATRQSPRFGFAWARLAELQFSFGRNDVAGESVRRSLELASRNAQAQALDGFLLAAQNRNATALARFDRAIGIDGALGNAWLGRGLVLIRAGRLREGLQDLQVAAALEPQRALLRSYLAKAFSEAWDNDRARKELQLAQLLDPGDPTAWLYSAIIHQQENQVNAAVRDLERAKSLNRNRGVYRSRLLLDQDEAVQSVNLASIYRDAGMFDVGFREASRAVALDYASYSAHLFLANSYDTLRDPGLNDLRYETAHLSEYLTANLLAPPGAGLLSRAITQQEYSRFFERDRVRIASSTEYLSDGSWMQEGALFGKFGNTGFTIESAYRTENGQNMNDELEHLTWSAAIKQQLTAQDSIYFQAVLSDFEGGDQTPYYDPNVGIPEYRVHEEQEPLVLAGYHREWAPNSHTLLLASWLTDDHELENPAQSVLLLGRNAMNEVVATARPVPPTSRLEYRSETEIYSVEAQQIWQAERHGFVAGVRLQNGEFDTQSTLGPGSPTFVGNETASSAVAFATPPFGQRTVSDFNRVNSYLYYDWQPLDPLLFTGGISYDHLRFPGNFRMPPLSEGEETEDQFSPKLGLIWTPRDGTGVRGSYTRSLGGVSFDQSFRLEPTQVGGFNQAFRNIIPAAVVGTLSGAEFAVAAVGIDQRFGSGTYLAVEGQWLSSEADRSVGAIDMTTSVPPLFTLSSVRQQLDYRERRLVVNVNQLFGEGLSLGARYALVDARLDSVFPEIPVSINRGSVSTEEALFHQVSLYGLFNHASGFFASAEALWLNQETRKGPPEYLDEDVWHFNAWAGWRFAQRRAEAAVGLLNISAQDYRLNPLVAVRGLPRDRTFSTRLRFLF